MILIVEYAHMEALWLAEEHIIGRHELVGFWFLSALTLILLFVIIKTIHIISFFNIVIMHFEFYFSK